MMAAYPGAPDDISDVIRAYEKQVGEIETLMGDLTPEQMCSRPVKGKWSVLELLCHLADSEVVLADRMKRAIALPNALLVAYDESRFVTELAYDRREPAEEFAVIRSTRAQMARILRAIPEDAWNRKAIHTERGINTVLDIAQTAVGHTMHHLPFLREKRRALGL